METWQQFMNEQKDEAYMKSLNSTLKSERRRVNVFPDNKDVFNAFKLTPFKDVKVVMLGQNPYHGPNQAHGLAFSVQKGNKVPPSLVNIYKELHNDIKFTIPDHGDLTQWAKQGVLLLNSSLTVIQGDATSHMNIGWDTFTDRVIKTLSDEHTGIVFVLWGAYAGSRSRLIDKDKHYILSCAHPSPLSAHRGFFGCKHFSQINQLLEQEGKGFIDWQIT